MISTMLHRMRPGHWHVEIFALVVLAGSGSGSFLSLFCNWIELSFSNDANVVGGSHDGVCQQQPEQLGVLLECSGILQECY